MSKEETALFLGMAAAVDSRIVTPAVVNVWHDLVGEYTVQEARDALRQHRATSEKYLQPIHIIRIVEEQRRRAYLRRPRAIETP